MNLIKASATIGIYTLASRVTGFVRDILVAALLGTGMVADAFFIAFKLPNLFRRLFAEGAFSAGFVPIFSTLLEREGHDGARRFAEEAMAVLAIALFVLLAIFEVFMPWLMLGLAPGFRSDPEKFDLAVQFTRITFPYLLLVSLVSLLGGLLNSLGRFAALAATPILLNLTMIGTLLLLTPLLPTPGHALAWGVTLSGLLQLAWMLVAAARAGYRLRPRQPRLTPQVRELGRLMAPAVIGSGAAQVNIAIDIIIASLLPTGSVSYLFFADRLTQLPLGVVGVAVGTALLPLLSRQVGSGDEKGAMHSLNRAIELVLLLGVPAAVALIVAAGPIVQVLFERGAFSPEATRATAAAVAAFAVGVPAYVLIKVLSPPFFARRDTRTPVIIAVVALMLNIVLNLALMGPLKHVGLALATAISAWVNAAALGFMLRRRGHLVIDHQLRRAVLRGSLAVMAMALVLGIAMVLLAPAFAGPGLVQVAALGALVGAGAATYGLAIQLLGVADLKRLARGR